MSTRRWLKAHWKQVIIHTSIVVVFVLLVIFVVEPLFDRLERIPGEAQLCRLQLPAVTNDIQFCIDHIAATTHMAEVAGWAFIKGHDSLNSEIYIVLKSADRTYVFDAEERLKEGVTEHFEELNLNLDYSGFVSLIPARKIDNGEYTVGFYITKGDIEALTYTNRTLRKTGEILEIK